MTALAQLPNLASQVLRLPLADAVAALPPAVTGSTARYTAAIAGGAVGVSDGAAHGSSDIGLCGECRAELPASVSTGEQLGVVRFCCFECARAGATKRSGKSIRTQLFALERGVCQVCKMDMHAAYLQLSAMSVPERLRALAKLLPEGYAVPRGAGDDSFHEGVLWQADHVVAVAEGGGECSLLNLRTLCTRCHALVRVLAHVVWLRRMHARDGFRLYALNRKPPHCGGDYASTR